MKKYIVSSFIIFLIISFFPKDIYSVFESSKKEKVSPFIKKEIRHQIKNEIRNQIRQENKGLDEKIRNRVQESLKNIFNSSVKIQGKIIEVSKDFLKISSSDGKLYKVIITSKTQLRRRFWGKATPEEFLVGHEVNVVGRFIDPEKTTIEAVLIRNLSIQRRWGVFFGKVKEKNEKSFTLETVDRGDLTVYLSSSTKIINRQGKEISYQEIKTGDRVRVKGVWDRNEKKIIEVEEIKDFSLPSVSLSPKK